MSTRGCRRELSEKEITDLEKRGGDSYLAEEKGGAYHDDADRVSISDVCPSGRQVFAARNSDDVNFGDRMWG